MITQLLFGHLNSYEINYYGLKELISGKYRINNKEGAESFYKCEDKRSYYFTKSTFFRTLPIYAIGIFILIGPPEIKLCQSTLFCV